MSFRKFLSSTQFMLKSNWGQGAEVGKPFCPRSPRAPSVQSTSLPLRFLEKPREGTSKHVPLRFLVTCHLVAWLICSRALDELDNC